MCGSRLSRRNRHVWVSLRSAATNGVNPNAYLKHLLTEFPSANAKDLDVLLPWNFQPQPEPEVVI